MEGYRGDPAATAEAFTVDGWLRTGDRGELDAEDRLVVHGRSDDAIRSGGETVWPDEVEAALRSHPGVADVAVTGASDHEWGQRVVAWVVPVDRALPPTLEELREHSRERLARFKAPRELNVVDALPRTPSGKLRRAAVPGRATDPRP
jgi:acyl-CoA synthetase (AMP-forming)/AMP-acid ligase II